LLQGAEDARQHRLGLGGVLTAVGVAVLPLHHPPGGSAAPRGCRPMVPRDGPGTWATPPCAGADLLTPGKLDVETADECFARRI
jgi:hypothetical protein